MRRKRTEGETAQQTLARLAAAAPSIASHATPEPKASWRRRLWRAEPTRVAKPAFWFFVAGLVAVFVLLPHYLWPGTTQTAAATGVVRDLDPAYDGMCFPQVDFVVDDATFTAVPEWSSEPCPWVLGELATVRYDPENPSDADVEQTGLLSLILTLVPVGLLLTAFAALALAVIGWSRPYWLWAGRSSAALVRRLLGR